MFTEISRSAGMNRWIGCVRLSWKPLILLMNICMSSAWTTVCIVKMRISQIQREMNRQRISLLIRSDFIKGRNFRFTMTLGDDWMFTITVSKSVKQRRALSHA